MSVVRNSKRTVVLLRKEESRKKAKCSEQDQPPSVMRSMSDFVSEWLFDLNKSEGI